MKPILHVLLLLALFSSANEANACSSEITIKYRDTAYCLDNSECIDTSKSSFVRNACYNAYQNYMVIKLQNTWYHYCRFGNGDWQSFKTADSFGKHYNASIKGRFDCMQGGVP